MSYVVGIDLGTSSTKTMIMDTVGNPVGVGNAEYSLEVPMPGYAQQNPIEWWEGVAAASKIALKKARDEHSVSPDEILGIGFSGQMHGVVLLDEHMEPVCPAIIHLDQRSGPERSAIRSIAAELMEKELLNQPSAGMMISTLYWIKVHEPGLLDRARYALSPKDYIRYRLCGEIGAEYTDAGAALGFAIGEYRWSYELIRRLGLPERLFVDVHESSHVAGVVTNEAAQFTGFAPGTKVVYGCGDSMAAQTGNGVVDTGTMACNIGTSCQLAVVVDTPAFDPKMRVQTWNHTLRGRWVVQSGALNGGSALNWLKNKALKDSRGYALLDEQAFNVKAGAEGVYFLPYLAGERTPYNDPQAKGVFFGLGLRHDQGHLIRATMEGVMFNLRACRGIFDEMGLPVKRLIASGGAARGRTWRQIQADMLDMPVHTTCVEEEACHGAAILALVGAGVYKNVEEACAATVRLSDDVTMPTPENVKMYRERQAIFDELYADLKGLFPKAGALLK